MTVVVCSILSLRGQARFQCPLTCSDERQRFIRELELAEARARQSSDAMLKTSVAQRERELAAQYEEELARRQAAWANELQSRETERRLRAKISSCQTDPIPG